MFKRKQLLEKKQALIQALINNYNHIQLKDYYSNDLLEHLTYQFELKRLKSDIQKLNRAHRHNARAPHNMIFSSSFGAQYQELENEFLSLVKKVHRFTSLAYLAMGYLGLGIFIASMFIVPEIYAFIVLLPLALTAIVSWAILIRIFFDPHNPVIVRQVFSEEELINKLSIFNVNDSLILSIQSSDFFEQYPASTFKELMIARTPKLITTLRIISAPLDQLPIEYLLTLRDALPHITRFEVDAQLVEKMSFEQLDALAALVPNAELIVQSKSAVSEKTNYFESKPNSRAIAVLSQLEQGVQISSQRRTAGYPSDIINHTAAFFPRSKIICKELTRLRDERCNLMPDTDNNMVRVQPS